MAAVLQKVHTQAAWAGRWQGLPRNKLQQPQEVGTVSKLCIQVLDPDTRLRSGLGADVGLAQHLLPTPL